MRISGKILSLVVVFVIATSSVAMACHSDYFDEIFAKIQKQSLDKTQMAAIWKLHAQFDHSKSLDHKHGLSCKAHDKHVPQFVASAAGVLNDAQFKAVTGKEKTETQKLRYEIFQLKQEIAEIKALIAELKKQ
jgi:hypothetical protein